MAWSAKSDSRRGHFLQRQLARQVAERGRQRQTVTLPPELLLQLFDRFRERQSGGRVCALLQERFAISGRASERLAQEGRKAFRPPDRIELAARCVIRKSSLQRHCPKTASHETSRAAQSFALGMMVET